MNKFIPIISILFIATAAIVQGEVYTETELKIQLPFGESNSTESSKAYTVERVIDGDTIKLTNGETVILIGIDALKTITIEEAQKVMGTKEDLETITKMWQEATEFVKGLNIEGKEVRLEFDVQKKDKYGRLLAYVIILWPWEFPIEGVYLHLVGYDQENDDYRKSVLLNASIIKSGYAQPMTIPPNVKYAELFEKLYEGARENKRGLWR